MANLVLKTNTVGNDVSVEMLRGDSYCDWRIVNTGGNLCMQANWTTEKVDYYNVLKLDYNTGAMTAKGRITAPGITSSGQVFITSTNETALTANTGALLIGTASGTHLSLDANEIQAKSSGTAATTLNLNPHGGVTQFGGAIYVASTAEASLTSGTGGIRVGSTSGTHLAIDGNEIQAKSSATAASALYLNPHGGVIYANSGSLIIPVKASTYTSSTPGEIWIVA